MFKTISESFFVIVLTLAITSNAFAASLTLDKIGSLDLSGNKFTEWWYTGANPLLSGKGTPNSTVNIKINDDSYTANVDSSENWSYQANIAQGDYSIVISQGSESYSFTLHLGQDMPVSGESTASVPSTGFDQIAGISLGTGILLLSTYLYVWGDNSKKVAYKKTYIEE